MRFATIIPVATALGIIIAKLANTVPFSPWKRSRAFWCAVRAILASCERLERFGED
jgi:hypothetical protein